LVLGLILSVAYPARSTPVLGIALVGVLNSQDGDQPLYGARAWMKFAGRSVKVGRPLRLFITTQQPTRPGSRQVCTPLSRMDGEVMEWNVDPGRTGRGACTDLRGIDAAAQTSDATAPCGACHDTSQVPLWSSEPEGHVQKGAPIWRYMPEAQGACGSSPGRHPIRQQRTGMSASRTAQDAHPPVPPRPTSAGFRRRSILTKAR
jgi:hypothetical protein